MTITIHKSNSNLQQKGAGVWDSVLSLVNQFGGQLGLKDHTHTHMPTSKSQHKLCPWARELQQGSEMRTE